MAGDEAVKLRRTASNGSDELAILDEAIVSADAECATALAAEETTRTEGDKIIGGLAAELGRGSISKDEYDVRKSEALAAAAKATNDRERAEAVASALRTEAADLAESIALARVSNDESEVTEHDQELARLAAETDRVQGIRAEAADRLHVAQEALRSARAPYDPVSREEECHRQQQERELAHYWAREPRWRLDRANLSQPMLAKVKEEQERLSREAERARADLRERSRRDLARLGVSPDEIPRPGYRDFDRV